MTIVQELQSMVDDFKAALGDKFRVAHEIEKDDVIALEAAIELLAHYAPPNI